MSRLVTVPAQAGTGRIDNVDVAQLLCHIGEASASTNPVDLFGLLLAAQRVLSATPATSLNADEAKLIESFRNMDTASRITTLSVGTSLAKSFPRRRPALKLVKMSQRGGAR